ncbi:MAG: CHAT domain-containing protein, partial [Mariniblastus sp.]|nr:CHAT domain-containing protein [Mariniblastus sp.]
MTNRSPLNHAVTWSAVMFCLFWLTPTVTAQFRSRLPSQQYYNLFFDYYQADYKNSLEEFNQGANGAFKMGTDRFLDSVCYWTMMGECHYHMGNYAQAVELYEQALGLYLNYAAGGWQSRVQQPVIRPQTTAVQRAGIPWYTPQRVGGVADLPDTFQMMFGRVDAERAFVEGGAVQKAEFKSVDVAEIMRCVGLAIHRRRVIKGATCKPDPFTDTLVSGLSQMDRDQTPLGTWNRLLLGLAYASAEDYRRSQSLIGESLQLPGGLDHQLTPVGLLTLAQISLLENQTDAAARLALEASYSAALRNQYDLAEESLSLGTMVHLSRERSVYPPLESAIAWAARDRANLMQAGLIVRLAECYSEMGDAVASTKVLSQTRRPMSRNSLSRSVIASRMQYLIALNQFLQGDTKDGLNNLGKALRSFQNGSRWLYQLALADSLVVSGAVGDRQATALYSKLLRDPSLQEWRVDPIECLAFLTSSHVGAMERWFEIAVSIRNFELAMEVAELVRRHRFYSSLPLGGRMLAFRWMLHGPEEALNDQAKKERQDFFTRYPNYKLLADRAKKARAELQKLPVKPDPDTDELKQQTALYLDLFKTSQAQEEFLSTLALRREPSEMVFPPALNFSEMQSRIGPRQLALVSIATTNGYHQFAIGQRDKQYLGLIKPAQLKKGIGSMFKAMGIQDTAGGMEVEAIQSSEWKQAASELRAMVFNQVEAQLWDQFDELVVVPDGLMWYLPFEVLQLGDDPANFSALGDQLKIRYSPTLSLAFEPQRSDRQIVRTAVVTGRLHPKGEAELSNAEFDELQKAIPDAAAFTDRMKIPSNLVGSVSDEMIVWADVKQPNKGGVFSLLPVQIDQGKEGSTLAGWMSLPLEGPEHIILPGYTSGGAAGSRSRGTGQDLFQLVCGLLASGSRTILISRWRVGGENSLAQTRDYATRLHEQRPIDAWSDSVKDSKKRELKLENEPRIKPEKLDQPIVAEHPFFWAGMMLVEVPNDGTANPPANADDPSAVPPLPGNPGAPDQVQPPGDAGPMKQDQKADDQKADDQKADDQKADDQKADDQKADDQKADDQKADDQ